MDPDQTGRLINRRVARIIHRSVGAFETEMGVGRSQGGHVTRVNPDRNRDGNPRTKKTTTQQEIPDITVRWKRSRIRIRVLECSHNNRFSRHGSAPQDATVLCMADLGWILASSVERANPNHRRPEHHTDKSACAHDLLSTRTGRPGNSRRHTCAAPAVRNHGDRAVRLLGMPC